MFFFANGALIYYIPISDISASVDDYNNNIVLMSKDINKKKEIEFLMKMFISLIKCIIQVSAELFGVQIEILYFLTL